MTVGSGPFLLRTTGDSYCPTAPPSSPGCDARACLRFTSRPVALIAEAGGDVVGVDWRIDLADAWRLVGEDRGIQGNLDPALLLGPWHGVEDGARRVIDAAGGRPGHIFNLGHGVLPETPVDNLRLVVETVHEWAPERVA